MGSEEKRTHNTAMLMGIFIIIIHLKENLHTTPEKKETKIRKLK